MPVVLNELLGRPLIKIYQDTDSFNFSIDSMLLADFASVTVRTEKICDLCSGNAPIPLYLTLRTNAKIYGVEVQEHSFDLALKSIEENKLDDRITMINANLVGISKEIGSSAFDLVTVNPPFFKIGDNQINPNDAKAIARHEVLATLDDIVKEASALLNTRGRLAMVHRPDRLVEILEVFKKYHIEPKRLRFVYPKEGKECNHILIEGIRNGSQGGLKILPPLFVYGDDGKWTSEILEIYNYERK